MDENQSQVHTTESIKKCNRSKIFETESNLERSLHQSELRQNNHCSRRGATAAPEYSNSPSPQLYMHVRLSHVYISRQQEQTVPDDLRACPAERQNLLRRFCGERLRHVGRDE